MCRGDIPNLEGHSETHKRLHHPLTYPTLTFNLHCSMHNDIRPIVHTQQCSASRRSDSSSKNSMCHPDKPGTVSHWLLGPQEDHCTAKTAVRQPTSDSVRPAHSSLVHLACRRGSEPRTSVWMYHGGTPARGRNSGPSIDRGTSRQRKTRANWCYRHADTRAQRGRPWITQTSRQFRRGTASRWRYGSVQAAESTGYRGTQRTTYTTRLGAARLRPIQ